jgi:hypothetical protein
MEKFFITNPLILEEQNSFKIIGTYAEQFSGMDKLLQKYISGNFYVQRGITPTKFRES